MVSLKLDRCATSAVYPNRKSEWCCLQQSYNKTYTGDNCLANSCHHANEPASSSKLHHQHCTAQLHLLCTAEQYVSKMTNILFSSTCGGGGVTQPVTGKSQKIIVCARCSSKLAAMIQGPESVAHEWTVVLKVFKQSHLPPSSGDHL